MSMFTIGLLAGGVIGLPIAVWLAKRKKEKEERDGSKDLPL